MFTKNLARVFLLAAVVSSLLSQLSGRQVTVLQKAPTVDVMRSDRNTLNLGDAYSSAPTVLTFYHGGWCQQCKTQLAELARSEDELTSMGYQLLVISTDAPEFLHESTANLKTAMLALSDSSAAAASAFGVARRVDETLGENEAQNLNMAERTGGHNTDLLAAPVIYIIGVDGIEKVLFGKSDFTHYFVTKQELLQGAVDAMW